MSCLVGTFSVMDKTVTKCDHVSWVLQWSALSLSPVTKWWVLIPKWVFMCVICIFQLVSQCLSCIHVSTSCAQKNFELRKLENSLLLTGLCASGTVLKVVIATGQMPFVAYMYSTVKSFIWSSVGFYPLSTSTVFFPGPEATRPDRRVRKIHSSLLPVLHRWLWSIQSTASIEISAHLATFQAILID